MMNETFKQSFSTYRIRTDSNNEDTCQELAILISVIRSFKSMTRHLLLQSQLDNKSFI